jgi:hypothetical protein
MNKEYHFLLMSQQDLLQNEAIEEIVRERTTSNFLQNKKNDFWIIVSPKFVLNSEISLKIEKSNFYNQKKQSILSNLDNSKFYVAIISLNKEFINWLKLRLGYFEDINNLSSNKLEDTNNSYTSNGICGTLSNSLNVNQNKQKFTFISNFLHPSILINKYQILLKSFYSYQKT